jgi:APA family basic amino acid/polyamine antiporter
MLISAMAGDRTSGGGGDQEVKVTERTGSPRLPRTLGLWSGIALVIGITIGSGIFRSPAGIARLVPSPTLVLGLWVAGGIITLCGALSLAELAAALPESGGFYAYLREGWGRPTAFLFGWAELILIRASALGGIAIVFGEYLLRSLGVDPSTHSLTARALAAGAIAFASIANIAGARVGAMIVNVSTVAKFSALGALIATSFVLGGRHGGTFTHVMAASGATSAGNLGLALVSVLWAYDGFGDLSLVGGEVKDPARNLPRAIVGGTLAIIAIYSLANLAYLYMMPVDAIGRSPLVAADTMLAIFGRVGVGLVSSAVMVSSFSSLNGTMLAAPRIFFAMADDGLLFGAMARVHPRHGTPHAAILLAGLLGMTLVVSRTFEALTSTFVLAIWPFYALSVAAIFRLRRLRPDIARPYQVPGYPVVPAIFIGSVACFVVNALISEPVPTMTTFALILAGLPVYRVCFSHGRRLV